MRVLLAAAALLVLAILAVYWQTGSHPFIGYDDDYYIIDNPRVTAGLTWEGVRWAFTTFHEANWHPLTWLSHMADVQLFGLDAGRHHLVNVALHGANALLFLCLLLRLTGRLGLSVAAALLFALHPLRVESVAWVSERKELLSAFFGLFALHAYAGRRLLTAWLLFALALMAKPMVVTIPFLLLLLDWWPLERIGREKTRRLLLEKVPFLLLTLGSCVVTIYAQRSGGAVVAVQKLGLPLRLANAAASYASYLKKSFWPVDLAVLYPFPATIPWWHWGVGALLLTAITGGALLAARHQRGVAVGWLWFLGTLVPVIGLVQVGQQGMADRYTYLPHMGLAIALVWGLVSLVPERLRRPGWGLALLGGIALLLAGASWRQTAYWRDSIGLFSHALQVTENNFVVHENLASALEAMGRREEALVHRDRALVLRPGLPESHFLRANSLFYLGRYQEAAAAYRTALSLKPDYSDAHNNLGATLHKLGDMEGAIRHYQEALRLNPADDKARQNLEGIEEESASVKAKR